MCIYFPFFVFLLPTTNQCIVNSLAYAELYITLGTLFRRFGIGELKSNQLTAEDLAYNDYFSAQSPGDAVKFHVSAAVSAEGS